MQVVIVMGCLSIVTSTRRCTFLICDDNLLLERYPNPSRKWRDRSRAKPDTVSTLRSWTVTNDRYASFKQVYGQVENLRRNCFNFAMMIPCWKQMPILQGNWWTGREQKEKLFLLCDDDPFLETDASPSKQLMDSSRTEGENISTLRWWSVAADRYSSFKQIDGQFENRRRKCFYFAMMICCSYRRVLQGNDGHVAK